MRPSTHARIAAILTGLFLWTLTPDTCADTSLAQSTCPIENSTCPQTTFGWLLFEDSNRGVPDFWFLDSIAVEEISICPHGVHLVFEVTQRENRHVAALTFPNPSPELLGKRMGFDPYSPHGRARCDQYEARYGTLLSNLEQILGMEIRGGRRFDFRKGLPTQWPLLRHRRRELRLEWNGKSAELRGYLDVYLVLQV